MKQDQLASLIATRMCHDLASPVGAVANLADMLRDSTDDQIADDIGMLCKTAERGAALLKFFRMVLGSRTASEPGVPTKTFAELAQCQAIAKRITVRIDAPVDTLSAEEAQLLGLLLMVGVSVVGLKGNVLVRLADPVGGGPSVIASGEKVGLSGDRRALLTGAPPERLSPGLIEFILLAGLLGPSRSTIEIDEQPGTIALLVRGQIGESPAA
ncbi:MAG: histidine phosphotransferase family protein [Pseudomonadota bacterium]